MTPSLLFSLVLALQAASEAPTPARIRAAVEKSVPLLEESAAEYIVQRDCFSCHHQAMPVLALATAKKRGFKVDAAGFEKQVGHTAAFLTKNREQFEKGNGTGGQADTAGYALLTLHAGGHKPDATTAAVAGYLLGKSKDRDYWPTSSQRPPSEASSFATTYLAVLGLHSYGSKEKQPDADARFEKARKWLLATKPKDTEDRGFRLKALKLIGADVKEVTAATAELAKMQRPDGGWSQLETMESDAYATGSALAALHEAGGMPTKDPAYRRGLSYLLKTQHDDGSWHVKSRSKPFQAYFESGFPHGKDQWISCAATSWAVVALALAGER